jgi:hypothetical protein
VWAAYIIDFGISHNQPLENLPFLKNESKSTFKKGGAKNKNGLGEVRAKTHLSQLREKSV